MLGIVDENLGPLDRVAKNLKEVLLATARIQSYGTGGTSTSSTSAPRSAIRCPSRRPPDGIPGNCSDEHQELPRALAGPHRDHLDHRHHDRHDASPSSSTSFRSSSRPTRSRPSSPTRRVSIARTRSGRRDQGRHGRGDRARRQTGASSRWRSITGSRSPMTRSPRSSSQRSWGRSSSRSRARAAGRSSRRATDPAREDVRSLRDLSGRQPRERTSSRISTGRCSTHARRAHEARRTIAKEEVGSALRGSERAGRKSEREGRRARVAVAGATSSPRSRRRGRRDRAPDRRIERRSGNPGRNNEKRSSRCWSPRSSWPPS